MAKILQVTGQRSPGHSEHWHRGDAWSMWCLENLEGYLSVLHLYTLVYIYIYIIYIYISYIYTYIYIYIYLASLWSLNECGCIWNMDIKRHDITQILIYTLYFHIHSTSDWLRLYLVDSFNYFWQLLFSSYFRDEAIHVSGNPWRVYVVSFMSYVYLPVI